MTNIIGIDIGGTKCAVSLGLLNEGQITVQGKETLKTQDFPGPGLMIPKLIESAGDLLKNQGLSFRNVKAVGISCGGPLNSKTGMVLSPPNLPGWDEVPIVSLIKDKFNCDVVLQNDANACAVAEWKFGAGRGFQNIVFLTFGTGMGAGLILDGRLYSGTNDMAGEVGHIRLENFGPVGYGKAGSFEGFCSGSGIAQLAQMRIREKFQMGETVSFCKSTAEIADITAQDVAVAALNGDKLALEVYHICGAYLGKGIAALIDILNPERIILGSIYFRTQELLVASLTENLQKEALVLSRSVCQVVPAQLNEKIGDYAALSVATLGIKTD